MYSLLIALMMAVALPSLVFGQSASVDVNSQTSASTSTTIVEQQSIEVSSGNLSTSLSITENDLGVPKPSRWEFIKRRIARTFSFSQIKKLRLDNERAKLLLVQSRIELQNGHAEKAANLIDQYNSQMNKVVTEITTLAGQVSTQNNEQAQALINQITEQKVLEASVLDALSLKATGEFNRKTQDAKLKALRDLVKILDKENLSDDQLHKKLDQISEKLTKKTIKAEEKFAKRLALKEELDKANESENKDEQIQEALDEQDDETLDEIAKTQKENLGQIVKEIEGSVQKHLLVLEELLGRVPEEAKPAIQESIDRSQKKLAETLEKVKEDQQEIERRIDQSIGQAKERQKEHEEIRQKALERLKERVKDQEKIKQEVEKREKVIRERIQKKLSDPQGEDQDHDEDDAVSKPTSGSKSSETSGTSESASNSSPSSQSNNRQTSDSSKESTATPEVKMYEVKYKDGRFDISNVPASISVNDSIKFKNEDDQVIDIESNPHPVHTSFTALNIGRLAKGEEKTVKLTQTGTVGFHNHLVPSITGLVVVK